MLLQASVVDGDLIITNLDQNFIIGNAEGNLRDQRLTISGDKLGNLDILVEDAKLFDPVSGDTLLPGDTLSLSGFTGGIDADFGATWRAWTATTSRPYWRLSPLAFEEEIPAA